MSRALCLIDRELGMARGRHRKGHGQIECFELGFRSSSAAKVFKPRSWADRAWKAHYQRSALVRSL